MNRRQSIRLTGATLLSASAMPARAAAVAPLKVGFVHIGPIGDFGWTYQHDVGRQAALDQFGDAIRTTSVENVAEGPDCERVLNELAASGHALIFATSFGYMNAVARAAARHKGVLFEHATGYKRAPNVSTYNIRFYQARYVQGVIAGKLSRAGLAGYVASLPVPEVVQGLDAFMLGMRSINPQARLKFVLVNAWYDPPKEGDAAKALMDQGCDVITQHTDSPAPLQAAAGRGVKAFGQSTDMARFAPDTQLSATLDVWAPYYIARIRAVLGGTWASTDTWGGFDSGLLTMSPFENMPADVKALAEATVADVTAGTNPVFRGPIDDQAGAPRVAAGHVLDDAALSGLQWLARGVDGKLT